MNEIIPGQTISHFRITEKLGSGGMGEIYKAEDIELKRTVALKFLPSSFSSDEESKKRLIHEAQAASSLDHPNICTIYEIGKTDDELLFISMALYDGETLKDKIAKGPVEINEAINITQQICEGLDKAHRNEIIHRDIKPANVFITTDGIVKILDFGLAKSKGQTQLTQMGSTMGTVDYMSPEQATGSVLDKRTDIWSLGVMFYEMITGQRPFAGEYEQAVIYSILNTEPDLSNISNDIATIISRSVNKSAEQRYQSAEEMNIDLESLREGTKVKRKYIPMRLSRISTRTKTIAAAALVILLASIFYFNLSGSEVNKAVEVKKKMIVVLPFKNLGSTEDEYFAQGMRDEISNKLAELGSIGVISRSSAEKYADTKKTAKEIGKELGVDYIIEGTVQWAKYKDKPSRIKIIPQLVRVSDDINIWSDSFNREIKDVFNVQSEIAQNVVDKLGIKILPRQFASESPPTKNLDAYEYFLKGARFEFGHISTSEILESIKNYEIAVNLDSNFAAAHALLSTVYMGSYFYIKREPAALDKFKRHLKKARELNPNLAEVHLAQGYYYYYLLPNGLKKSMEEFKKTLEISPNNAEANFAIGLINYYMGKYDLRLPFVLKAFSLDPLNARYVMGVVYTYWLQRDYKNAEKYCKRWIELAPKNNDPYFFLATNNIDWKSDTKLARKIVKNIKNDEILFFLIRLDILDRNFNEALTQLKSAKKEYLDYYYEFIPNSQMIALIYKYMKNNELSRTYFDSSKIELEKKYLANPNDIRLPLSLSIAYAGLGDKTKSLDAFNKAMELAPKNVEILTKVYQIEYLAEIQTLLGDYDNALKQIDYLLANYTGFSVNRLKLDPLYDPLRNLSGYKAIIDKYSSRMD